MSGASFPPATLKTIPNMGSALRNQGWSLINGLSCNLSQMINRTPQALYNSSTKSGVTFQWDEVSPISVPAIRFVVGNWWGNSQPNGEIANPNDYFIHSAAYVEGATANPIPATYSGERLGVVSPKTVKVSDPVQFAPVAGTAYNVRHFFGTAAVGNSFPAGVNNGSGSTGWQPNATDGANPEDVVELLSWPIGHSNSFNATLHSAILGFTGNSPAKSLAMLGDSIMAGTGDGGGPYNNINGWGVRIALGASNVNVQWPSQGTKYGYALLARASDTVANFITAGQHECRLQMASLATTVISNFGTNDLGPNLATIKANILTLAGMVAQLGVNSFIQATILPRTTSTDGWKTTANQTVTGNETTRTGLNSWLRDNSASGFVAQANAANPGTQCVFQCFDAAAAVEVNSSNVLTLNGGFWKAPSGSAVYSGSVTTGGGSPLVQFTDSALTGAVNQYRGYALIWNTGPNTNGVCTIASNSPTFVQTYGSSTWASNAVVGNTYSIYADLSTQDGTHPTSYAHQLIAASFPASMIL